VKLTALPGDAPEKHFASCLQPDMSITDDKFNADQPSFHQALQEVSPEQFLFIQRIRHTQEQTLAVQIHSAGNQHGCTPDLYIEPHLLVQSIHVELDNCSQRSVAPGFQDSPNKATDRLTCVEEISLPHNRLEIAATL
jgi:hypothetical protein